MSAHPCDHESDEAVVERLLAQRHSCRAFRDRPVPMPTIERLLGLAQLSPSWCNTQPWQVFVTQPEATDRLRNFALFDAPHVAIVTSERDLGTYGAVDCGVYLGHFLTAAQSLGLATVPQAALAAVAPVLRAELDLPQHRTVLFGVSFGYADPAAPANAFRTPRAPLDEVRTIVS